MNSASKRQFAFNHLPWVLRVSILKSVDFVERLELLKSIMVIRQEILQQGLFPRKVDRLTLDFSNFRLENGKLKAYNLYITVGTRQEVLFGQLEYVPLLLRPLKRHFFSITRANHRYFQKLVPRSVSIKSQQHETALIDNFEVFQFLPKVGEILQLEIFYPSIPEVVQDALFDNFPTKYTEAGCMNLWRITPHLHNLFRNCYNECQMFTLDDCSGEELWETLQKTRIHFFENHIIDHNEMRALLNKTLDRGLPLREPGSEIVFWTFGFKYPRFEHQPVLEFMPELISIFEDPGNSVQPLEERQEFAIWAKYPRNYLEEHCFRKNIDGIDYAWKLAKDQKNVFVFVRKLGA